MERGCLARVSEKCRLGDEVGGVGEVVGLCYVLICLFTMVWKMVGRKRDVLLRGGLSWEHVTRIPPSSIDWGGKFGAA